MLPPQAYFEAITNGGYTGTFWEGLPLYVAAAMTTAPNFDDPYFFNIFYGHLWFLQYLFLISLFVLPLLLSLRSERGQGFIAKFAGGCSHGGGIFFFLISKAIVRIALVQFFQGQQYSWAHFLIFTIFFVIGYIIPADARFTEGIKKLGWVYLVLGTVGFAAEGIFIFVLKYNYANLYPPGGEPFSLRYVLFNAAMSIAGWSWDAFMLSLGTKYLNVKSKLVTYGNEAVLPFYIFHQTIILCVGWFVIRWDMGILSKYLIIAVISFALIIVLYEVLVRPFNLVRFFFGMRPKKKLAEPVAASPEGFGA